MNVSASPFGERVGSLHVCDRIELLASQLAGRPGREAGRSLAEHVLRHNVDDALRRALTAAHKAASRGKETGVAAPMMPPRLSSAIAKPAYIPWRDHARRHNPPTAPNVRPIQHLDACGDHEEICLLHDHLRIGWPSARELL